MTDTATASPQQQDRLSILKSNYVNIQNEINQAAQNSNRNISTITLVAVSKTKPSSDIKLLHEHTQQQHFGENYVPELVTKANELPRTIKWHMIGHVQSNKAKMLACIPNLYMVETLDSINLATKLNRFRSIELPKLNVYLQVNTSLEESKSGIHLMTDCLTLAKHVLTKCPQLNLMGLMTIGDPTKDSHEGFNKLKEYQQYLVANLGGIKMELSMGMSNDYKEAIENGSNNVRVGRLLFGDR